MNEAETIAYFKRRYEILQAGQAAYQEEFEKHRATIGQARALIKARGRASEVEGKLLAALNAEYDYNRW